MPKAKKKTAGPARGFATTSVAKKVVEQPTEPEPAEAIVASEVSPSKANAATNEAATAPGEEAAKSTELDPEQAELQALAEALKPACDKEVARLVKVGRTVVEAALY
jgi:ATP-dependent RNA helicase DHX29